MDAAPNAVTVDALIERVWRGAVVSDGTVTQRIRLLRQALGDDSRDPRYIATLRQEGYRLVAEVRNARAGEGLAVAQPRRPRMSSMALPAIGLVGLMVVLGAALVGRDGSDGGVRSASSKTSDSSSKAGASKTAFDETTPARPPISTPKLAVPPGPVTAADLVQQAKRRIDQRNAQSMTHAIELYEQALALAPKDPEVLAGLARALSLSVAWFERPKPLAERAERLARESLAIRTTVAGELALGLSLDSRGRVDAARLAYQRAVSIDPTNWRARASLAYLLQVQGKLVEALEQNLAAMQHGGTGTIEVQVASCLRLLEFRNIASEWLARLDSLRPDSPHAAPARAVDLIGRGMYPEAEQVIRNALARGVRQNEFYEYLVVIALQKDDMRKARRILGEVDGDGPATVIWHWYAIVKAMDGGRRGVRARVEQIRDEIEKGGTWPENYLYIALLEAAAHRDEQALQALRRLYEAGYRDYIWLARMAPFRRLRRQPQYVRLLMAMREDVFRQRAQALSEPWFPSDLVAKTTGTATVAPPAE